MTAGSAKSFRRSQRKKKKKYSDFAKPRRKFMAGRMKKEAKPEPKPRLVKGEKVVAAGRLRTHGGKVCTSSGLAATMKRDLTAWIKAERIARDLRAQIAQLPVGGSTSLVGPRFKDPIFNRHAEAKDNARACEKQVR
jgi:hypothetical protein